MPARPATTEYRTNFLPPAENNPGKMPAFYGTAPHKQTDVLESIRKPMISRQHLHRRKDTLMEDWLRRTKSQHFGAFSNSYPNPAPFSSNTDRDAHLRLPDLPSNSRTELSAEERYQRTYSVLLKRMKDRQVHADFATKKLPGGGKGVWRHIKESYGAGQSLLSWVDGCRALEESGSIERRTIPHERPCGGKGPNRFVVDSYGAGPNVIAWISGNPVRESRFTTCLPMLPTMHQQQRVGGDHALVGGQLRREEVRGLRD